LSLVDDGLMRAWLAARSMARQLPMPVADRGGWRVDTGKPEERRRYLFTQPLPGLRELGREIDSPFVGLKLCGAGEQLITQLPERWRIVSDPMTRVMVRTVPGEAQPLPKGFAIEMDQRGSVTHARILEGEALAASGYSAEIDGVFIYDRIRTEEAYQRRGLGRALMAALGAMRRSSRSREVLTATPAGRSLYLQLGWRDYSAYSTAMIPPPSIVTRSRKAPSRSR
jgi:hypothetical protein